MCRGILNSAETPERASTVGVSTVPMRQTKGFFSLSEKKMTEILKSYLVSYREINGEPSFGLHGDGQTDVWVDRPVVDRSGCVPARSNFFGRWVLPFRVVTMVQTPSGFRLIETERWGANSSDPVQVASRKGWVEVPHDRWPATWATLRS